MFWSICRLCESCSKYIFCLDLSIYIFCWNDVCRCIYLREILRWMEEGQSIVRGVRCSWNKAICRWGGKDVRISKFLRSFHSFWLYSDRDLRLSYYICYPFYILRLIVAGTYCSSRRRIPSRKCYRYIFYIFERLCPVSFFYLRFRSC